MVISFLFSNLDKRSNDEECTQLGLQPESKIQKLAEWQRNDAGELITQLLAFLVWLGALHVSLITFELVYYGTWHRR